jgi:hypothetical protein
MFANEREPFGQQGAVENSSLYSVDRAVPEKWSWRTAMRTKITLLGSLYGLVTLVPALCPLAAKAQSSANINQATLLEPRPEDEGGLNRGTPPYSRREERHRL